MSGDLPVVHEGLEGVLVTKTRLSEVDGRAGTLVIAGHAVEALSGRIPFEAACLLLASGELPSAPRVEQFRVELAEARVRAGRAASPTSAEPMSALRTALSGLPPSATLADALACAALATAGVARARGVASSEPDPALGHAADCLRLWRGHAGSEAEARLLDAYLVTVIEHGLNASTFAARVVASTAADRVAALVAGVAALSGPLHGGAPGPVLDLLDRAGTPAGAAAAVQRELEAGRRIMGMGHRVYRVRDPRAFALERALAEYEASGASSPRLSLARAVEREAERALAERRPERALRANVEFYTAVLLDTLGLPRELFTNVFACSRLAGYSAHYDEQRREGRLIRPSSLYTGPRPAAYS